MIIEILLLFIIAILIYIGLKFKPIIKMIECAGNIFDQVDTPSPLERKRDFLKQNLSHLNTGKKKWTAEMIDKASEKQVENLRKKIQGANTKELISKLSDQELINALVSKFAGVDNFEGMMNDIQSNFLVQNSASKLIGSKLSGITGTSFISSMDVVGSYAFEKCGFWLALLSVGCTIFNHLDWEKFAKIAEQRRMEPLDDFFCDKKESSSTSTLPSSLPSTSTSSLPSTSTSSLPSTSTSSFK